MRPLIGSILFSATIGMVTAALIAAAILFYLIGHAQGFPWTAALITGLVISATDPVAVVTQLKEANAPEKLATLIEGIRLLVDNTIHWFWCGIVYSSFSSNNEPMASE
jgi:CPA1 family monovalent cation:H+ antiporter